MIITILPESIITFNSRLCRVIQISIGRWYVSLYESDGASRRHFVSSCWMSDGAWRRQDDVGCRTKFFADPGGVFCTLKMIDFTEKLL